MEIEEKISILKSRGTKNLVEKLHKAEAALETALRDAASFKDLNRGYLSSTGDCQEVKRILAELSAQVPETHEGGKKFTLTDREVWLQKQRTENDELTGAINKQRSVVFTLENNEIGIEMARRRLEGTRAVLALTTQQIGFLASG